MKYLALLIFLLHFNVYSSPTSPTPEEFQKLLKLDYIAFDQTLPNGGWRAITDNIEGAKVIDAYHLHNLEKLTTQQSRILYWHAGQRYASGDLNDVAINRFNKSYDPNEKANDPFKWNSYVRGTIAFLEHDMKMLVQARDELRQTSSNPNLRILEAFIRCFNKTYKEAYSSSCVSFYGP